MRNTYLILKECKAPVWFARLFSIALFITYPGLLKAQEITISNGSNMVLNGNVSLVLNNAAIKNNGVFAAGNSTVSFLGHQDTVLSNVSGANTTTFYNLSVTKSAFGVALKSPVVVRNILLVNGGNLYTDSNLTLRSDISLTARVGIVPPGCNIIGKTHVERYIPSKRAWRLLTAPVTNSNTIFNTWQNRGVYTPGLGTLVTGPNPTGAAGNGLDVSLQNTISLKKFSTATQQFTNVANTKVAISPGNSGSADNTGYVIFVRGDRDPANTNVINSNITTLTSIGTLQTGTQTFAASNVYDRYTLVGNPYASPVDFNNVTLTNLVKRFYVWDPTINSLGGYVMLDDLNNDGIYVKTIGASTQTKDIQSSQAFFVQTSANATASITFNESSKSGNNNNTVFRPLSPGTVSGFGKGQVVAALYLLNTDKSTLIADGVIAEFDDIYSESVNLDDAGKFTNIGENLSIVKNNILLAAERRPVADFNDTVYFRITKAVHRDYQLVLDVKGLEQPGMEAFLEDSYLNTSTLVSLAGITKVNFTADGTNSSASANRFRIVFKPQAAVLPVTIKTVVAYKKNNDIAVEWKVENEINMVQYDVEKSTDGNVFTHVSTTMVTGANNAANTYNWLDIHAVKGNNFYRIKSYDRNGQTKYSSIVKVTIGKSGAGFSVYPNPITGSLFHLLMDNKAAGNYQLLITNATGQAVFTKGIQYNGGNEDKVINTGATLTTGIYQLEIIDENNQRFAQKLIVK